MTTLLLCLLVVFVFIAAFGLGMAAQDIGHHQRLARQRREQRARKRQREDNYVSNRLAGVDTRPDMPLLKEKPNA